MSEFTLPRYYDISFNDDDCISQDRDMDGSDGFVGVTYLIMMVMVMIMIIMMMILIIRMIIITMLVVMVLKFEVIDRHNSNEHNVFLL